MSVEGERDSQNQKKGKENKPEDSKDSSGKDDDEPYLKPEAIAPARLVFERNPIESGIVDTKAGVLVPQKYENSHLSEPALETTKKNLNEIFGYGEQQDKEIKITDEQIHRMFHKAKTALEMSYSPYTGLKEAAALLASSGKIYAGCRVEFAAEPLNICAIRNAIGRAIESGENSFIACLTLSSDEHISPPCGMCLQSLAEFGGALLIIMANIKEEFTVARLKKLMPYYYRKRMK
ncbi:MAG: cytidine deaminase [Thermoplasmata archaeon]